MNIESIEKRIKARISKMHRAKILKPDYYRWRAISEGEMFGAWAAELEISALGSNGAYFERCRHYKKMIWYARKAALQSA